MPGASRNPSFLFKELPQQQKHWEPLIQVIRNVMHFQTLRPRHFNISDHDNEGKRLFGFDSECSPPNLLIGPNTDYYVARISWEQRQHGQISYYRPLDVSSTQLVVVV